MILKPISLALADVLSKDSVYLPLTAQHKAKLLEHVPAGEETILTIIYSPISSADWSPLSSDLMPVRFSTLSMTSLLRLARLP